MTVLNLSDTEDEASYFGGPPEQGREDDGEGSTTAIQNADDDDDQSTVAAAAGMMEEDRALAVADQEEAVKKSVKFETVVEETAYYDIDAPPAARLGMKDTPPPQRGGSGGGSGDDKVAASNQSPTSAMDHPEGATTNGAGMPNDNRAGGFDTEAWKQQCTDLIESTGPELVEMIEGIYKFAVEETSVYGNSLTNVAENYFLPVLQAEEKETRVLEQTGQSVFRHVHTVVGGPNGRGRRGANEAMEVDSHR